MNRLTTAAPASQADRPFGMRDKIGYALGDFGCQMMLCAHHRISGRLLYAVYRINRGNLGNHHHFPENMGCGQRPDYGRDYGQQAHQRKKQV